jgi:hypothetical protein
MAGLGYRAFASGEVLTAANLQGYAVDQSVMVFSTAADRTTALPLPSQGMVSWLNDTGVMETYYDLYNVSTNPGGREAAGWYTTSRNGSMTPIVPSSLTVAGTSASANSMGVVTFTAITSLKLNNVFSASFLNYKALINVTTGAGSDNVQLRMKMDGAGATSYFHSGVRQFGSTVDAGALTGASTAQFILSIAGRDAAGASADVTIFAPFVAQNTKYSCQSGGNSTASEQQSFHIRGRLNDTASYTTMEILPSSSNISGTIQVFGYNA